VPGSEKKTDSENLLVVEANQWHLVEVAPDGKPTKYDLSPMMLRRITYPCFKLVGPPVRIAADVYFDSSGISLYSEAAWINGSTVVRLGADCPGRDLVYVPGSFRSIRYVPLSLRPNWLTAVSGVPTCALTGATLTPTTQFASPDSKEIAEAVGESFGQAAHTHGIRVMASASMRGHVKLMSADHDFTYGFCKNPGCQAVHFKGSNLVALHGEAWEMKHGISYILEEERCNFSNNAKEAALMASLTNQQSISFLANGGPTVAMNLCRMLVLCGKNRVFTLTGLHSNSGKSGASGCFSHSLEQLESTITALHDLSPLFFDRFKLPRRGDQLMKELVSKPLRLLNWVENEGVVETTYILKPDCPNTAVNPGVQGSKKTIQLYAVGCMQKICETLKEPI